MYRIVNQQGETIAIVTRKEDAAALVRTLKGEPPLKIKLDTSK